MHKNVNPNERKIYTGNIIESFLFYVLLNK